MFSMLKENLILQNIIARSAKEMAKSKVVHKL